YLNRRLGRKPQHRHADRDVGVSIPTYMAFGRATRLPIGVPFLPYIEREAAVVSYTPMHSVPSREQALHALYEAAELEHCLMCTYLYAAFSLKTSVDEGVTPAQLEAITRWKRSMLQVAIEEMGHLMSVWNITVARGAPPSATVMFHSIRATCRPVS